MGGSFPPLPRYLPRLNRWPGWDSPITEGPVTLPEIDPLAEALDITGLTLAGACGPKGAPLSPQGREEAAKLIYEVARVFDDTPGPGDQHDHASEPRNTVDL